MQNEKPLGRKAYGSIPHLIGSRMGPADHHATEGQTRIATERVRDKHDRIYVQEKLDGSCVSVANIDGEIVPLGRAGYRADSSPFRQHHMFAAWAYENQDRFSDLLQHGERAVGEWLAQAHGTRYELGDREPFALFDIIEGTERLTVEGLYERNIISGARFDVPPLLADKPLSIEYAMESLNTYGYYGALDPVEGAVWRVERNGKVDFLVKYVRPDKKDGIYLPEISGKPEVWNWKPSPLCVT